MEMVKRLWQNKMLWMNYCMTCFIEGNGNISYSEVPYTPLLW